MKNDNEPVVTAKKYIAYKNENGILSNFKPPKVILVCYQQSILNFLLIKHSAIKKCKSFSDVYYMPNEEIGILAGWGMGAPALVTKLEQLIEMGVKKFVAIGIAGSLMEHHKIGDFALSSKALAEDGVAHHYLPEGTSFAFADNVLIDKWFNYIQEHQLPTFHNIPTWSFSAIFKETPRAIKRVKELGCGLVEMEAATLYAIGQEKNIQTISLFVVSDTINESHWIPHLKSSVVMNNLKKLSEYALNFCETI